MLSPATKRDRKAAPFNQFASASSAWLFSRPKKEATQPYNAPNHHPATLANGMTDMWEKARFALPPLADVMAFQTSVPAALSKMRMGSGNKSSDETDTGAESDTTTTAHEKRDWRSLYSSPWFVKGPSSPPPMYSPRDALQLEPVALRTPPLPSPSIISEASSSPSSTSSSSSPPHSKRQAAPRHDLSESIMQSYHHHERKMRDLGTDRMLWLFCALLSLRLFLRSSLTFLRSCPQGSPFSSSSFPSPSTPTWLTFGPSSKPSSTLFSLVPPLPSSATSVKPSSIINCSFPTTSSPCLLS